MYAAERVPVAICSGAARAEIEPVVESAGIADMLRGIISSDDVIDGKPNPEGYLKALELLGAVRPGEVLAIDDTEAGIASAKAAGLLTFAKTGTLDPLRLAAADELVDRVDVELMRRVLG
jgi:HAD superfamily hydrolase (TIGR01509 family)